MSIQIVTHLSLGEVAHVTMWNSSINFFRLILWHRIISYNNMHLRKSLTSSCTRKFEKQFLRFQNFFKLQTTIASVKSITWVSLESLLDTLSKQSSWKYHLPLTFSRNSCSKGGYSHPPRGWLTVKGLTTKIKRRTNTREARITAN